MGWREGNVLPSRNTRTTVCSVESACGSLLADIRASGWGRESHLDRTSSESEYRSSTLVMLALPPGVSNSREYERFLNFRQVATELRWLAWRLWLAITVWLMTDKVALEDKGASSAN